MWLHDCSKPCASPNSDSATREEGALLIRHYAYVRTLKNGVDDVSHVQVPIWQAMVPALP